MDGIISDNYSNFNRFYNVSNYSKDFLPQYAGMRNGNPVFDNKQIMTYPVDKGGYTSREPYASKEPYASREPYRGNYMEPRNQVSAASQIDSRYMREGFMNGDFTLIDELPFDNVRGEWDYQPGDRARIPSDGGGDLSYQMSYKNILEREPSSRINAVSVLPPDNYEYRKNPYQNSQSVLSPLGYQPNYTPATSCVSSFEHFDACPVCSNIMKSKMKFAYAIIAILFLVILFLVCKKGK